MLVNRRTPTGRFVTTQAKVVVVVAVAAAVEGKLLGMCGRRWVGTRDGIWILVGLDILKRRKGETSMWEG